MVTEIKWKRFCDGMPGCEWIWISDGENVWLEKESSFYPKSYHENMVWAEARMIYPNPPVPEKKAFMSEWISVKDRLPILNQFVAAIRLPWPSFYWIGIYKGVPNEDEDMFDYWMPLPKPPECKETQ